MEGFECAYRDPKSPLTPITPLDQNNAFNFNISVKPTKTPVSSTTLLSPHPSHYSVDVSRVRQVFEKKTENTLQPPQAATRRRVITPQRISPPVQQRRLPFSPCQAAVNKRNNGAPEKQHLRQPSPYIHNLKVQAARVLPRDIKPQKRNASNCMCNVEAAYGRGKAGATAEGRGDVVGGAGGRGNAANSAGASGGAARGAGGAAGRRSNAAAGANGIAAAEAVASTRLNIAYVRRQFKRCSPIRPRPLCPRISYLLSAMGQEKHKQLFEREEIDFDLFCNLKENDLLSIGVSDPLDRENIIRAVHLAQKYEHS